MNKKIALFFVTILSLILFAIITMIGVREKVRENAVGAKDIIAYEYSKNPNEINYKMVEFLLETNDEKRKAYLEQDITGFQKVVDNRINFYNKVNDDVIPLKKGAKINLFFFHEPYFAISTGFKITITNAENNDTEELYFPKDLERVFISEYLIFTLHKAGYKGTYDNHREYFYYLEIKALKDIPKNISYTYVIDCKDISHGSLERTFFVELGEE